MMVEGRVKMWDRSTGWMEDGTIPKGQFANVIYQDFCQDPMEAITAAYREIGSTMNDSEAAKGKAYLDNKPRGVFGKHDYKTGGGGDGTADRERAALSRYMEYFGVPSEG
jgi:hypothetical protein